MDKTGTVAEYEDICSELVIFCTKLPSSATRFTS